MSAATRILAPFVRAVAVAAAVAALAFAAPASAQEDIEPTYTLLVAFADKGLDCDLLRPWETATIRAESERLLTGADEAEAERIRAAAAEQTAATACDDELMNAWIEAARPGIGGEWMPPYLAIFHALATMQPADPEFAERAGDIDFARAAEAIEMRYEALAEDGFVPEGGSDWAAFQQLIDDVAIDLLDAIENGDNGTFTAAEAEAALAGAIDITRLWLADRETMDE